MFNEDLVGCWKISEKEGNEIVTRWIDNDGTVVKTERTVIHQ